MKKILLFVFCFILFTNIFGQGDDTLTVTEIDRMINLKLKEHRFNSKTHITKSIFKSLKRKRNIRILGSEYKYNVHKKMFKGKSKEERKNIERKILKDNGKMYYYLEGINYLFNRGKVTEEDSAKAMTYIMAAYFIDSLGYEFAQDEMIESVWNIAGRKNISKKYLDTVALAPLEKNIDTLIKYQGKALIDYFKNKLSTINENIRKWKEDIKKKEKDIMDNKRKKRKFERKKNFIHRIKLDKEAIRKKSMTEIDKLADNLEGGRMSELSDVATVGYKKIGRGVKFADIKGIEIDGYVTAKYCDKKTTKITNAIIMSILQNSKSDSIKIVFKIKGMSDGQGYGKPIRPYNGDDLEDILDEFHTYLQRRDDNRGDTTVTFLTGSIFTNRDLAFLRAYCFKYNMKKTIERNKRVDLNIENTYSIHAIENYEEGDKYRGIDIDISIEGLFSHYSDSIAFLEKEEERLIKNIISMEDSIDKAIQKRKKIEKYLDDAMYKNGGKILELIEEVDMVATRKTLKKIRKKEKEDHKKGIRKVYFIGCFTNDGILSDESDVLAKETVKMYEKYTEGDNIVLKTKLYMNLLYRKEYIENYIKRIRVQKNDVIIFYYFGHGYRVNRQSRWPNLLVGNLDDNKDEKGIKMKTIKKLLKKRSKFEQIIIESCNADKDSFPATLPVFLENKYLHLSSGNNVGNFNKLHFKNKGYLITSSCSPHEWSFTNDSTSGYFGEIFFDEIKHQCSYEISGAPKWNSILKNTKEKMDKYAKESDGKQTPQYEMKLKHDGDNRIMWFISKIKN